MQWTIPLDTPGGALAAPGGVVVFGLVVAVTRTLGRAPVARPVPAHRLTAGAVASDGREAAASLALVTESVDPGTTALRMLGRRR